MCLERVSEKKVAEENIFCWKMLQGFSGKSYIQDYKYKTGVVQPRVEIRKTRHDGVIEQGYHSWVHQEPTDRFGRSDRKKVSHLFVIPKGTVYYEGLENGGALGYASESIVYLGHIFNPLTWIRKLKYLNM